jgi:CO/xanthine dehydrogenase Mo-binding subunit
MKKERFRYVGTRTPRIDGRDKVTGKTKFSTDLYQGEMLWGMVLRSPYPHARIIKLDVTEARTLDGVDAVLTHKDVPGQNGFGVVGDNWPVLCEDRVRYQGDAVALVAATDEAKAEEALSLIEVEYEQLPVISTVAESLQPGAYPVHEKGNLMYSKELSKGDSDEMLEKAEIVVEGIYSTPFQEHAYLETEGGYAVYDENSGIISIWCGDQYPVLDQFQIGRALDFGTEKIRVVGLFTGGSFGGKHEITVQIHLALLAYYTRKPVFLRWSREESLVVGEKRHAMESTFKIGTGKDGRFSAIDVNLEANAGPYDSISAAVLNVAMEASSGPYKYQAAHIKGQLWYANGAMGGSFRGFGGPQVAFGIEQEIDKIAVELDIDPIQLRLMNAIETGDTSAIGHTIPTSVGLKKTLLRAQEDELWRRKEEIKRELSHRFKYTKYGVGVASASKVVGMGPGIPDYSNVSIELDWDGMIIFKTGAIELGQGNLTAYVQMLAEGLECDLEIIRVINGDSAQCPDSGAIAASRSIQMVGNAILDAVDKFKKRLLKIVAGRLGVQSGELVYRKGRVLVKNAPEKNLGLKECAEIIRENRNSLEVVGSSVMQISDLDFGGGLPHIYFSYITALALVGVDPETGEIDLVKYVAIPEMGRAINSAGVEGQCEGGTVQGLGYALFENLVVKEGTIMTRGYSTYIIPTALDLPDILETIIVEDPEITGPFGAKGVGEMPTVPVAPAIANAVYDAVGIRFNKIPILPEEVAAALRKKKSLTTG